MDNGMLATMRETRPFGSQSEPDKARSFEGEIRKYEGRSLQRAFICNIIILSFNPAGHDSEYIANESTGNKSNLLEVGDGNVADASVLEHLGLEPQMKKNLGPFAILCVGFNICNSWVGLAATMVIGMESGGSVTILYGLIVVLFFLGCSALTMAELASVYPTAGGPYHWTSILAPEYSNRVLVSGGMSSVPRDTY